MNSSWVAPFGRLAGFRRGGGRLRSRWRRRQPARRRAGASADRGCAEPCLLPSDQQRSAGGAVPRVLVSPPAGRTRSARRRGLRRSSVYLAVVSFELLAAVSYTHLRAHETD